MFGAVDAATSSARWVLAAGLHCKAGPPGGLRQPATGAALALWCDAHSEGQAGTTFGQAIALDRQSR